MMAFINTRSLKGKSWQTATKLAALLLLSAPCWAPAQEYLVKDINSQVGTTDSNPSNLTPTANRLFFVANDGIHGDHLYVTDGSANGTTPLSLDFGTNFAPTNLTVVGSNVYFSADDSVNGRELWVTDGTPAGTRMVTDLEPTPGVGSYPANLLNVNGTLYFSTTGEWGYSLWRTDGTEAGTELLDSVSYGIGSLDNFTYTNDSLYFTLCANNTNMLWKYDQTFPCATKLSNLGWGPSFANVSRFVNVNGAYYFTTPLFFDQVQLFKLDLNFPEAMPVRVMWDSNPQNLISFNNALFFTAFDPQFGRELWKSDGTYDGTVMVKDIAVGSTNSDPSNFIAVGNKLYFIADDRVYGPRLWQTDGTEAGTVVSDIYRNGGFYNVQNLTNIGETLYFSANDGIHGQELWQSDGTAEGTFMIGDITGDSSDASPCLLTPMGNMLFFSAQSAQTGRELYAYAPQTASAPTVATPIPDQETTYLSFYEFPIPADTFAPADRTFTYTVEGLPFGIWFDPENKELIGFPYVSGEYYVTATATDNSGSKPLSASTTFKFTVKKAVPTVAWSAPANITYGTLLGADQLNATSDTYGSFDYSPKSGTVLNAGSNQMLSAVFYPADLTNNEIVTVSVPINVLKAPLTITANSLSRMYGSTNPPLTVNYNGFVNNDNASVLFGRPLVRCIASPLSPVGSYAIVVTNRFPARNYQITTVGGTLTVTPAPLIVTANNASKTYGEANPILDGTIMGIQNGDNITASFCSQATESSLVGEYAITPTLADPNNMIQNYAVTLNPGTLTIKPAELTVKITDPASGFVSPVSTNVVFTGTFTKSGYSDSYTAYWTFSTEGQPDEIVPASITNLTASCEIEFLVPGLYNVMLTVTNISGPSASATNVNDDLPASVVIYDPAGGFVTGGGWITSPVGACITEPAAGGKTTFGFNAKYLPGSTVPTGQVQFKFAAADLDFRSTAFEWLIVSGSQAQCKGSGTVNGQGDFTFVLTALDGQKDDTLRMQIWEKANGILVYDSQPGASNAADPATPVQGSVVVHRN